MSKRQRGNKEPKKPKDAAKRPTPAAATPARPSAVETAVSPTRAGRKA